MLKAAENMADLLEVQIRYLRTERMAKEVETVSREVQQLRLLAALERL